MGKNASPDRHLTNLVQNINLANLYIWVCKSHSYLNAPKSTLYEEVKREVRKSEIH